MGKARGQAFWARLVQEVEAGETRTRVAARHGVAGSAVGYWVRRLRRDASAVPVAASLLPVHVAGEERRRFGVIVATGRIEFDEGTDPAYVAAVVRALSAC